MSGLAGWVDFTRDLRTELPIVRAMVDTVGHRGPDGSGEWAGEHAVLAHRRRAAIDRAGGAQPVVLAERAVLLLDGMIHNYRELRSRLRSAGHEFRDDDLHARYWPLAAPSWNLNYFANYRVHHETTYEMPITASLWKLKTGISNDYTSKPQPGVERLDTLYFTSLILNWK